MAPTKSYLVEKIIDVRIRHGLKEFYLKWKNYPESSNSWINENNMDCQDLVKNFEKVSCYFPKLNVLLNRSILIRLFYIYSRDVEYCG